MLLTNIWDTLGWFIDNAWGILTFISIVAAMVQTWRTNRGNFWTKIKEVATELVKEVEAMDFKPGEGLLKKEYVIEKLLEEFSSKFAFISKKKLEKIVEVIVVSFNTFSDLN